MHLSSLECCYKVWLYFMFLKLSAQNSIITIAYTIFLDISLNFELWTWNFNFVEAYSNCMVWGDFSSMYSWFYEVIILEGTYAIGEGKKIKCISKYWIAFVVENK
jgi:hypothetical protein